MSRVLNVLREEQKSLQKQLNAVGAALKALGGWASSGKVVRKGKKMSAATKAKIRAAAKARWAKVKKA